MATAVTFTHITTVSLSEFNTIVQLHHKFTVSVEDQGLNYEWNILANEVPDLTALNSVEQLANKFNAVLGTQSVVRLTRSPK